LKETVRRRKKIRIIWITDFNKTAKLRTEKEEREQGSLSGKDMEDTKESA